MLEFLFDQLWGRAEGMLMIPGLFNNKNINNSSSNILTQ